MSDIVHDDCDDDDDDDEVLSNDPLFRFYFRSFARLYHQLLLLKPILIQGDIRTTANH
jgi:hypothetical protein